MKVHNFHLVLAIAGLLAGSNNVSGGAHEAPMPGLNWAFGADSGEELDCGDMWSLQRWENEADINYGGWFSGGITANNWGNTTMLGNSQLPFNNDPQQTACIR